MSKNSIDLNTVDQSTLERIQGVGPSLAAKIIDFRNQKGPFTSWDDLKKIPGMPVSMVDTLKRNAVTFDHKAA